ncbi:hypothetical protein NKI59_13750 [Mesorhizobium sp. M0598]|uniref:hypothetical protein n=1 Tax=Mesorhizobium sp. M0598 TaxID=2956968 RepID=UPI00333BF4C9
MPIAPIIDRARYRPPFNGACGEQSLRPQLQKSEPAQTTVQYRIKFEGHPTSVLDPLVMPEASELVVNFPPQQASTQPDIDRPQGHAVCLTPAHEAGGFAPNLRAVTSRTI